MFNNNNKKPRSDTLNRNTRYNVWVKNLNDWSHLNFNNKWDNWSKSFTMREHYEFILMDERPIHFPKYMSPTTLFESNKKALNETLEYLNELLDVTKKNKVTTPSKRKFVPGYASDSSDTNSDESDENWLYNKNDNIQPLNLNIINDHNEKKIRYTTFIMSLPFCVPLDFGFLVNVIPYGDDNFCWCPCQGTKFNHFRNLFHIDNEISWNCNRTKKLTPRGLIDHLSNKINDSSDRDLQLVHQLLFKFINVKYCEYIHDEDNNKWYKHSALYPYGSNDYTTVKNLEKLLYNVNETCVNENPTLNYDSLEDGVKENPTLNNDYDSLEDGEIPYVFLRDIVLEKIRSITDHNDDLQKFFEIVYEVAVLRKMELHQFVTLEGQQWDMIKYQQRYVSNRLEFLVILNILSVPLLIQKIYLIQNQITTMRNGDEVVINFKEYQLILEIGVEWIYNLHYQST